jgi:hypothetical protein
MKLMYKCGGIIFNSYEKAVFHYEWVFAHEGIVLGIELVK